MVEFTGPKDIKRFQTRLIIWKIHKGCFQTKTVLMLSQTDFLIMSPDLHQTDSETWVSLTKPRYHICLTTFLSSLKNKVLLSDDL